MVVSIMSHHCLGQTLYGGYLCCICTHYCTDKSHPPHNTSKASEHRPHSTGIHRTPPMSPPSPSCHHHYHAPSPLPSISWSVHIIHYCDCHCCCFPLVLTSLLLSSQIPFNALKRPQTHAMILASAIARVSGASLLAKVFRLPCQGCRARAQHMIPAFIPASILLFFWCLPQFTPYYYCHCHRALLCACARVQ